MDLAWFNGLFPECVPVIAQSPPDADFAFYPCYAVKGTALTGAFPLVRVVGQNEVALKGRTTWVSKMVRHEEIFLTPLGPALFWSHSKEQAGTGDPAATLESHARLLGTSSFLRGTRPEIRGYPGFEDVERALGILEERGFEMVRFAQTRGKGAADYLLVQTGPGVGALIPLEGPEAEFLEERGFRRVRVEGGKLAFASLSLYPLVHAERERPGGKS